MGYLEVGDFNRGEPWELAQVDPSGTWLFASAGEGTFSVGVLGVPIKSGAVWIATADINGDGTLNLIVTVLESGSEHRATASFVALGNRDRTFPTLQHFAAPGTRTARLQPFQGTGLACRQPDYRGAGSELIGD